MTLSEIQEVSGYVGNFQVRVRRKARFVDEKACTACGKCAEVCPVIVSDEFQEGFSSRKAAYLPFPQAVPASYLIDMEHCLGNNPVACVKCMDACEKRCIDLTMKDEHLTLSVGAIIVATGMGVYDPTPLNEYGYTAYEDVITSMEFERLICGAGPSQGHLMRPSDHRTPQRIGFIQCVGSRTENRGNPYCSNVCCMNTVKDTLLIKEHYPDTEVYVFYMDLRAFGKGFEELLRRSKEAGVRYIRGLPGEIVEDPATRSLRLKAENTTTACVEDYELDMVVLAVGLEPREDLKQLTSLLNISQTADGFAMEAHPKLRPVDSPTAGIFFAGCVEAPKDVKDSVTQAGAAAARGVILLNSGSLKSEAIKAVVDREACTSCGICGRVCPYGAIRVDVKAKTPAEVVSAACSGCGTCAAECTFEAITMQHFTDQQILAQVDAALEHEPENKILAFLCNWCSYAGGDFAGSSRLKYPATTRFIRTMCSGRVDERFILRAFEKGAAMVLLSGCHFGDCHYIDANHWTVRRADRVWNLLESLEIRPERFQLEWISAAEGVKFAETMRSLEKMREKVTQAEIARSKTILTEYRLTKGLKKKGKAKNLETAEASK
jgi:heterodisulfide reductase subunit A